MSVSRGGSLFSEEIYNSSEIKLGYKLLFLTLHTSLRFRFQFTRHSFEMIISQVRSLTSGIFFPVLGFSAFKVHELFILSFLKSLRYFWGYLIEHN